MGNLFACFFPCPRGGGGGREFVGKIHMLGLFIGCACFREGFLRDERLSAAAAAAIGRTLRIGGIGE